MPFSASEWLSAHFVSQKDALQLQLTLSEEIRSSQELRLHSDYELQVNIELLKTALKESQAKVAEFDELQIRTLSLLGENEAIRRLTTTFVFSISAACNSNF